MTAARRIAALLSVVALGTGCSAPEAETEAAGTGGGGTLPDACTIVEPAELERFFGAPAGAGEPAGGGVVSGCEFRAEGQPYILHITLRDPDPIRAEYEFYLEEAKDPTVISGLGEAAHAVSSGDQSQLYFYKGAVLADMWTFYDRERTVDAVADVERLSNLGHQVAARL